MFSTCSELTPRAPIPDGRIWSYGCGLSLGLLAFFDNAIVFRFFTKIANRIDLIYFLIFLCNVTQHHLHFVTQKDIAYNKAMVYHELLLVQYREDPLRVP